MNYAKCIDKLVLLIIVLGSIVDVFYLGYFNDFLYLALLALWIFLSSRLKLAGDIFVFFALICLSLMILCLVIGARFNVIIAEKLGVWGLLFFSLAFYRFLIER